MLENDSVKWDRVIKQQLETHFLTQEQFAEKCNVSQKAVSLWINGKSTPSIIYQKKILQVIKDLEKELKLKSDSPPRTSSKFSNEEVILLYAYRKLSFYNRQSVLKFIRFLQSEGDVELLFQEVDYQEIKERDHATVTTTNYS